MATGALRFTQLEVWQRAHRAVLDVYRKAKIFPPRRALHSGRPDAESGDLGSGQHRRRLRPPQAEGQGHFYTMARSSAEEVRYYLILAEDLGYLNGAEADAAETEWDRVCGMLFGMIESMDARDAASRG